MTIDEIMQTAISAKEKELNVLREKAENQRRIDYDACTAFLEKIRPLEKYRMGLTYEIFQRQYNVYSASEEYFLPRFGWRVELMRKSGPFYSLKCKIIDGVPMAKWDNSILWHGPEIKGQNEEGYFTAEQFAMYWASQIR
jgi:hypothetical protein